MNILITGGAGFIGSHTADALLKDGHQVRVLDVLRPPVHPSRQWPVYLAPAVEKIRGDVRKRRDWEKSLEGIDVVFHFAAYQDYLPDFATFYDVNCTGTALLYQVAVMQRMPIKRVIIASSQAVYGEGPYRCRQHEKVYPPGREGTELKKGNWEPLCPHCKRKLEKLWAKEIDELHPHNAYAMSKRAQEELALQLGTRYDIETVVLRYSIVQGPRQSPFNPYSGALRIFAMSMREGKRPPIYEDGAQLRDFVNIHDVVAANLLTLTEQHAAGSIMNVGGGTAVSVNALYTLVARAVGTTETPRSSGKIKYRIGDTRHALSNISKLSALGWKPTHTVDESVNEYVAWISQIPVEAQFLNRARRKMERLGVVQ